MATIPVHQAYAEDAQRTENSVTYDGRAFSAINGGQNADSIPVPSSVLASVPGTTGYYSLDRSANKVAFLLTQGDPSQATSAQYVIYDFTPPSNFSNSSPPQTVTIATADASAQTDPESQSTCDGSTLSGIGWIVCPVVNFIAKSMDFIYGIIASFLEVKTVTADTNGPLYKLWSLVRDIANICFVLAFMLIVYSQVTSMGISNFGIKKMLPRLIVAAILMNVSYWICAFAIDASNLLGYSIHSLFRSLFESLSVGGNYTGEIPTWQQIAAVSLAGAGAAVGGIAILTGSATGSILLLIPIVVAAAGAALIALVVLAARQALLMCLVIISPLAFVAYILPNTEKYFDKWRSTSMTLLLLFPIFSVIFSGAQLAGMAIIQTAGGNLITIILGMGVLVAPIVITPLLVKFSSGLIGKIAGMANNPNKGLVDRTRKWAKGAQQERKNKILSDQNRFKRLNNSWLNPAGKATRALDTRKRRRESYRKSYETMAENRYGATNAGQKAEAFSRSADIQKQEVATKFDRSQHGQQVLYRKGMADVDKGRADTEFEASHRGHQIDHAKRVAEMDKKQVHNTHDAEWNRSVRTDAGLLQQELNVKASEISANFEKASLEKVHAEVVAQGHEAEHILNLRGVDDRARAGILNIAHDIKRGELETVVTQTAKGMADRVVAENRAEAYTDNKIIIDGKTIVEYAGGIKGQQGRNAVTSKAKSEVSAVLMEDTKNILSTMDYRLKTDNDRLSDKIKSTKDLSEQLAYVEAMASNGGPGIAAVRKLFSELGRDGGTIVESKNLDVFKEILASKQNITSAGKDMEFYLTNSAHIDPVTNKIQLKPDGTPLYKTFEELSQDTGTWKNLSASAFASQNATTQHYALEYLYNNDKPAYMQIIDSIRSNPGALNSLKQGVYERFSIYSDSQVASAAAQGRILEPGKLI